jgi:hypothetical protein
VLELLADDAERLEARVSAVTPSVLVVQRAYLPFWRAEVDGRPARPTVANLDRLALEVPAGDHHVRIWTDRRPLQWSWLGLPAALLVLVLATRRARREAPAAEGPPRLSAVDTGE